MPGDRPDQTLTRAEENAVELLRQGYEAPRRKTSNQHQLRFRHPERTHEEGIPVAYNVLRSLRRKGLARRVGTGDNQRFIAGRGLA